MTPSALSMPTTLTNTATISSTEPGPSNSGILTPRPVQPSSQSSTVNQLQSTSPTAQIVGGTTTTSISSTESAPSNSGILTPSSSIWQPSSQSSTANQLQNTSRAAQIVGVGSDGNQKVLATLQGSEIDDFEQVSKYAFMQRIECGINTFS
jgi:hypothetical protein